MPTSKVKSFIRNGKLVRAHSRKNQETKKKINIVKTGAKVIGGTALLGGAAYLGLKGRYIRNLDDAAKRLAQNVKNAPVVPNDKISFTIGGFAYPKNLKVTGERQSGLMRGLMRRDLSDHAIISFDTKFDPKSKSYIEWGKLLTSSPIKGRNLEAERLAQKAYDYAKSNPGKKINLIAYSGGSVIAEDAAYILKKAGVDTKLVTIGGMDFKFTPKHPKDKSLHITNKADDFHMLRKPNSFDSKEAKGHSLESYVRAKDVKDKLRDFLS